MFAKPRYQRKPPLPTVVTVTATIAGGLLVAGFLTWNLRQPMPPADVELKRALIAFKNSEKPVLPLTELRAQLHADWDTLCTTVYWNQSDKSTAAARMLGKVGSDYDWPLDFDGKLATWVTFKGQVLRTAVQVPRRDLEVSRQDGRPASTCVVVEQGRLIKGATPSSDISIYLETGDSHGS
jgi:hypothetical protein